MAVTVHIPKVGMTMEEGELVRWLVPDGTAVARGQPIFEMETEKVELEVEADDEGLLKHLVDEGTTLPPGAIVACLLGPGESDVPQEIRDQVAAQGDERSAAASAAPPAAAAPAGAGSPPAAPAARPAGGRVLATPIARRLAVEQGIDLASVTGTGPNGRIIESDVRAAAAGGGAAPAEPAAGAETIAYSGRRRTIGEHMQTSLQSMAQLTLSAEARVDEARSMLHDLNREWRGERVVATLSALVVKACALALQEHSHLNARLAGDRIVIEPQVNIGLAVDLAEGLMVPVVRGADELSLQDVARSIADLTERARDGSLSVDDMTGATFTVTSLEGFAVDAFTPVINPPQAAILGVGRVRDVAVFEGSSVQRGRATTLSLTFDHRVVDGAPAARFLGKVVELLGEPSALT